MSTDWQSMETAPRDGRYFEAKYEGEPEEWADLIRWQEHRSCMLATVARGAGQQGAGWESKHAGNLPVDEPDLWRDARKP